MCLKIVILAVQVRIIQDLQKRCPKEMAATAVSKFCSSWSGGSVGGTRRRRRHLINYSKLLGENTDSGREREREGEGRKEGRRSVFAVA